MVLFSCQVFITGHAQIISGYVGSQGRQGVTAFVYILFYKSLKKHVNLFWQIFCPFFFTGGGNTIVYNT
jgi:hypothetical protein